MKINYDWKPKILELKTGFKSFNLDKSNCYGKIFLENEKYHCDGEIKFGPHGNGFHFAERFEDTIRYSGIPEKGSVRDVLIAKVVGSGIVVSGFDEYNDYYDMYSCSDLYIEKFLTREEVISLALNLNELRMCRFVSLFRLTSDEISLFRNRCYIVDRTLDYYQKYDEAKKILK